MDPVCAAPESVDADDVDAIRLPTPDAKAWHAGIERLPMGIDTRIAAAVNDEIGALLQWECQLQHPALRSATTDCTNGLMSAIATAWIQKPSTLRAGATAIQTIRIGGRASWSATSRIIGLSPGD